jgi:hypothetical protein
LKTLTLNLCPAHMRHMPAGAMLSSYPSRLAYFRMHGKDHMQVIENKRWRVPLR